jgi:hypothetical protein
VTDAPLPEDPRDALIREQAERLAAQDRQLAQAAVQAEQIAVLEAMVADLLERLDAALRALSRNSGNSSMPPSSDDQPGGGRRGGSGGPRSGPPGKRGRGSSRAARARR